MHHKITKLLLLFVILASTREVNCESSKIVLAAENSWPPFAKIDGTGISFDLISEAMSNANYDVEFVSVPYARALRMAENGQTDGVFNVTKQKSTLKKFVFGTEPLFSVDAHYFYPPNSQKNYSKPSDIPSGTSVGVIIGYEYGNEYESVRMNFNEIKVSNQTQLIHLLLKGKINMAIMFDAVATYTLAEMGLTKTALEKGEINHTSDIFVAFSKHSIDVQDKIKALDEELKKIEQHRVY